MYIGFDLKIKLEDYIIESSDEIEKWKKIGQEYNAEIKKNAEENHLWKRCSAKRHPRTPRQMKRIILSVKILRRLCLQW